MRNAGLMLVLLACDPPAGDPTSAATADSSEPTSAGGPTAPGGESGTEGSTPGTGTPTTPTTPDALDNDGDGYPASEDCDDDDPEVHPGATEEVDGVDNDCDPSTCTGVAHNVPTYTTMDLTADGRPDLVLGSDCADPSVGEHHWLIYPGTSSGFASTPVEWSLPQGYRSPDNPPFYQFSETYPECWGAHNVPTYTTMDLTADGIPDLVLGYACDDASVGDDHWLVYPGGASGFAASPIEWSLPAEYRSPDNPPFYQFSGTYPECWGSHNVPTYTTMDLTADGIPDLVVGYACDDPSVGDDHWLVYPGGASGFASTAIEWGLPAAYRSPDYPPFYQFTGLYPECWSGHNVPTYTVMDLTADGAPDLLVGYACDEPAVGDDHWLVYPGGPDGFAATALEWSLPSAYRSPDYPPFYQFTGVYPECWSGHNVPTYTVKDLTADGAPDLVVGFACDDETVGDDHWLVYPGGPDGFAATPVEWSLPAAYRSPDMPPFYQFMGVYPECWDHHNVPTYRDLDLTADGAPDLVIGYACDDTSVGEDHWLMYQGDCVE